MSGCMLEVSLPGRAYPIHIAEGLATGALAARVREDQASQRAVVVITDTHVAAGQAAFLEAAFAGVPVLALPAGETTKSFAHLQACCDFMAAHALDRRGRVYAVGGGVIGDLAGFAAATYLRGVGFYQVPTSLLAMVDSSVGGKTGINIEAGKNLVGAFHQPLAVYADVSTLRTLPATEFAAGMAEVIKHGLLADAELFTWLEQLEVLEAQSEALPEVIRRNCAIKAGVVLADEREEAAVGGRALLNLGHTFGHAIEAVAGYGAYLHGEAVAIGLVLATRLSVSMGLIEASVSDRVEGLLRRYALPTSLRTPLSIDSLLAAARRDKKTRRGRLRYVVLQAVGRAQVCDSVEEAVVAELWRQAGAVD